MFNKKIFLTKKENSAAYLKHLFKDKIYIYFQNNIWIITSEKIKGYPQYNFTFENLNGLNLENDIIINLNDDFLIPSIGWEIQNKDFGFISYGYTSSLILKIKGISCEKKNKIKFNVEKYYKDFENNIKFSISNGNQKIANFDTDNLENFILDINCNADDVYNFTFEIDDPISLYDLNKGLNREKRSIILKSISII